MRECFKGDEATQWKRPKFDPLATRKPLNRSSQKIGMLDDVMDCTRHAKFCGDRFRGFCSPNTWFCCTFGDTSFFLLFGVLQRIFALIFWRIDKISEFWTYFHCKCGERLFRASGQKSVLAIRFGASISYKTDVFPLAYRVTFTGYIQWFVLLRCDLDP